VGIAIIICMGFRDKLINNRTDSEKILARILWKRCNALFEEQKEVMIGEQRYFMDFWFPHYKIGVELEGGIHKIKIEYDSKRQTSIESIHENGLDYEVLRFDNENLTDVSLLVFVNMLKRRLFRRKEEMLFKSGLTTDKNSLREIEEYERRKKQFLRLRKKGFVKKEDLDLQKLDKIYGHLVSFKDIKIA
jgi:very-short-patch-repair endonuclease